MKKIFLFLFLFSIIGCTIQFDGETKLVTEGKIVDKQGNPIVSKKIKIYAYNHYDSNLISYGNTDENGYFSLVFPAPMYIDDQVIIEVNENQNDNYQNKMIYSLRSNFTNYKLNLNTIVLFGTTDITQLQIILNHVNSNTSITDIQVEGLLPNEIEDLNSVNPFDYQSDVSFNVIKNQTVILKYKIIQNGIPTNFSQNITISNSPVNYTLNY